MSKEVVIVVMAGGMGKRMNSSLPKVLHPINKKPMICHVLEKANSLPCKVKRILVVVGKYRDVIQESIEKNLDDVITTNITYVDQPEAKGTGHALQCCIPELSKNPHADVLILSGDVPLIRTYTMNSILYGLNKVRIVVTKFIDPTGYGRIILKKGCFEKIVEQKDCDEEQLKVELVNCGIYGIKSQLLCKYLPYLTNDNSQKEYYLTDIIEIIKREEKIDIDLFMIEHSNQYEIMGVNTSEQLIELETLIQNKNK